MSKQKSKPKKTEKRAKAKAEAKAKSQSRRNFVLLPIAAVAVGGAGFSIHAIDTKNRELHDLSVIGQGQAVIVQIHDPQCPTCKRLKNIVSNALNDDDPVHFRLADITSSEGKALQDKHNVPHVTLLYFNAKGKHVHTTQGIQTQEQIRSALDLVVGAAS